MKYFSFTAQRWFAMLIVYLLLCGSYALSAAAAPAAYMPIDESGLSSGSGATDSGGVRTAAPAAHVAPSAPSAVAAVDDLTTALWGWWKFDEDSGTIAADSSLNGHDGTLHNFPTDNSQWKTDDAPIYPANAGSLLFAGSSDYVEVTAPTLGSYSLSAWVSYPVVSGEGLIFSQGKAWTLIGQQMRFGFNKSEYFVFEGQDDTSSCGVRHTSPPAGWHHWVGTWNNSMREAKLYLDGAWVGTFGCPGNGGFNPSGNLQIGRMEQNIDDWGFDGSIDDARVYQRLLSPLEIASLATRDTAACFAQAVAPGEVEVVLGTLGTTDASAVQTAINALGAAGGTVRLSGTCPQGTYGTIATLPELQSGATMTLEGGWNSAFTTHDAVVNTTTLNANHHGTVVYAPANIAGDGHLVLRDLTLINGHSTIGGGVYTRLPASLYNVTVRDNTADWRGGGVYGDSSLYLEDCTIADNFAGKNVETAWQWGAGGGVYANADLTMKGCTVSGNEAVFPYGTSIVDIGGGGICVEGDYLLEDSTVSGNTGFHGGGLHAAYSSGTTAGTIRRTTFSGNTAGYHGGGVYSQSTLNLIASDIYNNTTVYSGGGLFLGGSTTLEDTRIYSNTAGGSGGGGGAYVGGQLTFDGTTEGEIYGNTADNGGGIFVMTHGALNWTGGSIHDNRATRGAGLYFQGGTGNLNGASITDNVASSSEVNFSFGGGIFNYEGTVTLAGADIQGNTAARGGGIVAAAGTTTITGGTIQDNDATALGGGVYVYGGSVTIDSAAAVNGNQAPDGAGLYAAGGTTTVSGASIANNVASGAGGGVYATGAGGGVQLTSTTVSGNQASQGAGLFLGSSSLTTVTNSTISSNVASGAGGGAYVTGNGSSGGTLTLTSTTVANNLASQGAGLYLYDTGAITVITSMISSNGNAATTAGGGVVVDGNAGGTLQLTASTVSANQAADGAGLDVIAGTLKVLNSTITGNTATTSGGGVRVEGGAVSLGFATVTDNQAPAGAGTGLYAGGGTTKSTSSIIARNRTGAATYGADVRAVAGLTSGGGNTIGQGDTAAFAATLDQINVTDPKLGTLTDGYYPLLAGSPAINHAGCVVDSVTITTDQRGRERPGFGADTHCDSGSYETTSDCYATIDGSTVYRSADASALQQAIDAAVAGNKVKISGLCRGVSAVHSVTAYVGKSLTLEGGYDPADWSASPDPVAHPTTLDANGGQRVVHVRSGSTPTHATLRYLTITGAAGGSNGDGGGVAVEERSAATIDRCTVTNNRAVRGGGVYGAFNTSLTIRDSTISGNATTQYGGGVYSVSSLVMSGCVISGNSAINNGGGVSVGDMNPVFSQSYLATISTTTFDGNTVSDGGCGGGLRTVQYTGVTVTNSTFSNNAANGSGSDGGAICNKGGTLAVRSSTFADNQATDQGGAIFAYGANTVSSSTFYHNSAATGKMTYRVSGNFTSYGNIFAGSGQAGYCLGGTTAGPFTSATYNLDDGNSCAFSASSTNLVNTAPDLKSLGYYGGPTKTLPPKMGSPALDAGDPAYALAEAETDQRGQTRVAIGKADTAAPRIDIGAVEIDTTCFAVYDNGATISAVYAYEDASAVQAAMAAATTGNKIKLAGSCPAVLGSGNALSMDKDLTVEGGYAPRAWDDVDSDPVGNPTTLDGASRARVVLIPSGRTVTLRNLNITGGLTRNGGGIHNSGTLTLTDCNVFGNRSNGTGYDYGGGVYNSGSATIEGCAIYDNATVDVGGGVYNSGTLKITNSTLASNSVSLWGCPAGYPCRGGGGLYNQGAGTATIVATTFVNNRASGGANIYQQQGATVTGSTTIAASIVKAAAGYGNCGGNLVSGGFNRISNAECLATPQDSDLKNATIQLEPALGLNGGKTLNYLPTATPENAILDMIPPPDCERLLDTENPLDQRGRSRPRLGWMGEPVHDKWCDAGSVERGQEIWTVCGPPLDTTDNNPNGRCRFTTIAEALAPAADGDIVVVSGVLTEAVTVDKPVTIRGPRPEEITPGTHMGVVQAGQTAPAAGCTQGSSIFTIAAGTAVTIQDLNIRHGCAAQGGAIRNAGTLDLKRITIYDNFGATGGGVYNDGALTVTDSTLARNMSVTAGAGIYNASGKSATVKRSTLAENNLSAGTGSNLSNQGASLAVGGSILTTAGTGVQCTGTVTSLGYNLVNGPSCTFTAELTGDPLLGTLRDNGGATLTYAVPADSPAVDQGYPNASPDCAGQTDQRGLARPFDVANGLGQHCDIGAYEYGPRILTVDAKADPDPASLLYADLQEALDDAMTGDAVEVRAGVYTGNFVAYRDVTIRHAEIDVTRLSPELGVDVRAILQASTRTISEQRRLDEFAGTTLTVQGFEITSTSIEPSGNIAATLSGLTIRQGAGALGGGVHNRSNLTIDGCTIEGNAAVNTYNAASPPAIVTKGAGGAIYNTGQLTLIRSTVSGNRAEHYGGAIYNDGTGGTASAMVSASTLAGNMASPLAEQVVVAFRDGGLSETSLPIASGDEIRFENQTGQSHTMSVQNPPADVSCAPLSIDVPLIGGGLSEPLICTTAASVAPGGQRTVTVKDTAYGLTLVLTVTAPGYTPDGATLFQAGYSEATFDRSIVYSPGAIRTCARPEGWVYARITSAGTNLFGPEAVNGVAGQSTCSPVRGDTIDDPKLAGLADNNTIDFAAKAVGGYGWTHALLPSSRAIDAIAPAVCGAAVVHEIDLEAPRDAALSEGDIVRWRSSAARTAAFNDGRSDVRLVELPGGTATVEMQFNERRAYVYRVYDPVTQTQVGWATITVNPGQRARDQREVALPQRGSALSTYRCDIGAYEFTPWVVGQPLPRPPSSTGKQAPTWTVTGGIADTSGTYDVWSPARRLDLAVRPTRPGERAIVSWYMDDPTSGVRIIQSGIVVWPDAPQLHISGAPVNLGHSAINDGYAVSPEMAQAYEGQEPRLDLVGKIVSKNVFTRMVLPAEPGDSYSVLQFAKGTQTSGDVKAQVVRTVGWNTAGIRDMRDRDAGDGYGDTDCVIGRELRYPAITDTAGTLGGHDDPEGRPGWLLSGTAYDGAPTAADLTWTQNTTDGLVEPAHVRELRKGPILPILDVAPTAFPDMNLVSGGNDLEVAWYRPDGRNVAWPVKSAGYRCRWPTDEVTQKIVIASELGSELGGQAILDTARFKDATVYHQSDASKVGYSPNHEHALLAASALGNAAPALYALRTDLFDRDTGRAGAQSYALLKYRDAAQGGRIQIKTYRVDLTQPAAAITGAVTVAGAISPAAGPPAASAAAPDAGELTLQIGSGVLSPHRTVTVPVDAYGATNLRSAAITIDFDPTLLVPVRCTPNRTYVAERPHSVTVEADQGLLAQQVVHLRARAEAGTDLRWHWDFGDGTAQYDTRETSHVYATADSDPTTAGVQPYRVTVTASNGFFADEVTGVVEVVVVDTLTAPPVLLGVESGPYGCRIDAPGTLVLDLRTLNKHGLSGAFKLADVEFGPGSAWPPAGSAALQISATELAGPDYSELAYGIVAGTPVYAPAPLRGLLDIQPCAETQAADDPGTGTKPVSFWKDWKGMLWTRAAGDMSIQYFYPLQPGFYLDDAYALDHGLVDPDVPGAVLGEEERVGMCVPWLDELPTGAYPAGTEPLDWTDSTGEDRSDMVYPVGYRTSWPALPGLLNVGETVYERAKGGVSAIASQVAVARIYDDLAGGVWNNDSEAVEISGKGLDTYLTQLIDPLAQVSVELAVTVEDMPGLPTPIKSERLLYGGGLAIVGNTTDPDLNLPFALRSRVLYSESVADLDGDGVENGQLIFRGYYDGTSKEYIKGDPLLLLNVMSLSDRYRLQSLCDDDANPDCATWDTAIDALYWKTLNPRQLDLCRNANGETYAGDPGPAVQAAWNSNNKKMRSCTDDLVNPEFWRDGIPDRGDFAERPNGGYLIGVQDSDDNGVPEPYEGLGKGKALTAGNAAGTGYVTLVYNNDSSLGGLPVSLQVVKVQCAKNAANEESPYRGNLLVIKSDNLFDEKLTLRHTGDFGGRPDNFEFEWWIAAVDDTGVSPTVIPRSRPWQQWTRVEPGLAAPFDVLGPQITIEGANVTTLRDNWVIMRYKNNRCPVCGNQYRYSAFAGDPSAKPTEVRAQLAEGWIKRVVGALNPFDARVDDFVGSPTSTSVEMIRQAGTRYEGPIAMNADPENLNKVGLIEAYQTVLDRGRTLSIEAGVNDQGANAALLNVTSRIAQLYMLLGNDAYMDALDPIVGFDDPTLSLRAPAIYAFANQFRPDQFGLIDEELALLRGRDETLGGVAAGPTYNRLTWNFTNGEGEVAYVTNYNLNDINLDGFIDEADAAILYPQGHGDAYGQQLTALSLYYQLLKHPDYTWIPRAEPVSVGGAPVVVDYYDERRFAAAAASRARMGAEIVNLTLRKHYAEPNVQPYRDAHLDSSDACDTTATPGCNKRAWGVADWAGRAGEGAYFDWLVANAILPPEDDRYADVRKIDRMTVEDVRAISDQLSAIQTQLDRADQAVNPLGLSVDAVLFDLDPALTKTTPLMEGQTHFEQVYDRTISTMANTLKMFEYANQAKAAQRAEADEQHDFAADVVAEDRAMINELIELFGYPYAADIGVNGTYPDGYDGPDIFNYDLIERTELTNPASRCTGGTCPEGMITYIVEYEPMDCLGFFITAVQEGTVAAKTLCPNQSAGVAPPGVTQTISKTVEMGLGLDAGYGRYLPAAWPDGTTRKALGDIQMKLWGVYDTRIDYEQSLIAYRNHTVAMEEMATAIRDRYEVLARENKLKSDVRSVIDGLDAGIITVKEAIRILNNIADGLDKNFKTAAKCVPEVVGLANSIGSPAMCAIEFGGSIPAFVLKTIATQSELANDLMSFGKDVAQRELELELFGLEADFTLRQMGRDMQALLREEQSLELAAYLAADNYSGAMAEYDMAVQRGYRKLADLERMRKRWAGQVTGSRYNDMAYRLAGNDALAKYRQQFDLAQTYTFLTAAAYDYETNLRGDDPAAGEKFLRGIVGARSLGELRWTTGPWDVEPIVGSGGLAEPLGKMRDNFVVLKGQMGFNNPQSQASRFSLRQELFRLLDSSDAGWRATLQRYYTPDIYAHPAVDKLAKKPYGMTGPQPGLVIPFNSAILQGLNYFGLPLGPGDGAYNPTQFSTKVASVGVWFEGYDSTRLARMPYVYLLPAGDDVLRPRNLDGTLRYWSVTEQLLPLPYPLTAADFNNPEWIPGFDGVQGQLYKVKPYAAFQAFPYTEDMSADEMNTDTRLIGRSVWNTNWVLVIPGANLLADPQIGIDRFVQDVDDIYVYFQTYAYAGTMAAAAEATPEDVKPEAVMRAEGAAAAGTANPKPQPDALFYGVALRDGTPMTSGTLTAILPRLGTVTTEIKPIAGTTYNYSLPVPIGYYDASDTNYAADSARLGETVRFTVNGVPALLRDPAGVSYQAYPITWPGTGYLVTVDVSGPGSYPLGDVNVSGVRDSADALLVLKYDVGLVTGVTTWPPGPGTIYLPLCDISQDGKCNSTDALRILMCDVGLAECPMGAAVANTAGTPAEAASPAYFRLEQSVDADSGQVIVRLLAESPYTPLAAAAADLRYDPARFSVVSCAENPAARMDLAACNPAYAEGTVRYVGITTGGIVEAVPLLELRLQALDPAVLEQLGQGSPAVELTVTAAFDLGGNALRPITGAPPATGGSQKVYLPLIISAAGATKTSEELPLAPPTETPLPPAETPLPPAETPAPPTETPLPPTETPLPPAETPVPPAETPAPPTETPTMTETTPAP